MNWLLWLLIGLAVGWLIEFLWDYLFWQRKYEDSAAEANSRVLDLQASINGLKADLSGATAVKSSLESKIFDLQGKLSGSDTGLGLLAEAGGPLGLLGDALHSGKDADVRAAIGELNAELDAKTTLEGQLRRLLSENTERKAKRSNEPRP